MSQKIIFSEQLKFQYQKDSAELAFENIQIDKLQHTLLLGESGSGKTTLLHLLSGLSRPKSGKVFIEDTDIYAMSESKLDKFRAQHLGFIFQEPHLLKNLSVLENILLAQYLGKQNQDKTRVIDLLDKLQIADKAKSLPNELSRGQAQRVAIARAIINNPKIVIADEPTASLDDTNTNKVIDLLIETSSAYGATLVIATHDKRIKDSFSHTYKI